MKSFFLIAAAFCLNLVVCGAQENAPDLNDSKHLEKILSETVERTTNNDKAEEGGKKAIEWTYRKNGQKAIKVTYHKNGKKKTELVQINGKGDCLFTQYYENGQKMTEAHYKNGKQDGLFTEWYENGQKKREAHYKDGK